MKQFIKVLCVVLSAVCGVWAQSITVSNWNANAITIKTAEDLRELSRRTNSTVATEHRNGFEGVIITLANDIEFNGSQTNGWMSIRGFRGTFDGNNNIINGIYIGWEMGVFDNIHGKVKNLGIVNMYTRNGGLAMENYGVIENCYIEKSIFYSGQGGGVFVNENYGTITNCYAAVNLFREGANYNCKNTGFSYEAFGFVYRNGDNAYGSGTITNCYIVGADYLSANYSISAITNSYSDHNKTSAEMKQKTTFVGWDFNNVWSIKEGVSYPYLQSNGFVYTSDSVYTYTGNPIKIPINYFSQGITVELKEGFDYTAVYSDNVNAGITSVQIKLIGNYAHIGTRTVFFAIDKMSVEVEWDGEDLNGVVAVQWHGNPQLPTAVSSNGKYPIKITGDSKTNIDEKGWAYAELITPDNNIYLCNSSRNFKIVKRSIEVQWKDTILVYNKMQQAPTAIVEIDRGNGNIFKPELIVTNRAKEVDVYNEQAACMVQIADYEVAEKINLTNRTKAFEIVKKPLDVVIKDNGEAAEEIKIKRTKGITVGNALDSLRNAIGYNGFARDTVKNESDDASVISGKPKFEINQDNNSQRSTRAGLTADNLLTNGNYIVNIKVEDLFANNYSFNESKLDVAVLDDWIVFNNLVSSATPIKDFKKSDRKYGIIIEKNPVTADVAEIKIRAPERAETKVVIYDAVGNVVFEAVTRDDKLVWNLTNSADRAVANGAYLVTAQVRGVSGKTWGWSAKLGVRR